LITMKMILVICLLVVLVTGEKTYDGYKVFRTGRLNKTNADLLHEIRLTSGLDFWTEPRVGQQTDIMTPPEQEMSVLNWLDNQGITYHTMIKDVQQIVQETRPREKAEGVKSVMDWENYQDLDTLNQFIQDIADANEWASIINIGQSYEGRDMKVLAITKAGPGAPNIFMDSGLHAREWIGPAVATFIVNELVENYAAHPEYIDNINWYYIPVANPDGYVYSWDHDRMWRKTRSDTGSIFGCKGVDPNRNWDHHWAESGVSNDKCSLIYAGPEAFSEIELRNIRDFTQTLDPVPVLGHSFHSYSQLWLWPYGYAYNAYPENYEEIQQLAIDASDALYKVHGTVFDPVNAADLYPASGASDDWYKGVLGARFVFTTELRDTGHYGFVLPADQIIPSGEEMWAGFEVVINTILNL